MEIKELLVEGSTKNIYATEQKDEVIIEFQDKMPEWAAEKKASVKGKAPLNNAISAFIFEYLSSHHIPNHFIRLLDDKSFLAKRLEMIPFKLSISNYASKNLAKRFGLESGKQLEIPIVEIYLNNKKLKNPLINEYHAFALGLCDRSEMSSIMRMTMKANAVLKSFFLRKGLIIVNFQLEFGRDNGAICLGDELSVDTMILAERDNKGNPNFKNLDITGPAPINVYRQLKEKIVGSR